MDADGAGDVLERIQDDIVQVRYVLDPNIQPTRIDELGGISSHLEGEDLSVLSDQPECLHSSLHNDHGPLTLLVRYRCSRFSSTHLADRPPRIQLAPFDVLLAASSHSSHFNVSRSQAQHCFVRCRCRSEQGPKYKTAPKGDRGEKGWYRSSSAKEVEGRGRQGYRRARQENAIIGIYAGDIRRVRHPYARGASADQYAAECLFIVSETQIQPSGQTVSENWASGSKNTLKGIWPQLTSPTSLEVAMTQ